MQPKCPHCGGENLETQDHTGTSKFQTVTLIYCDSCGAVVGGAPFDLRTLTDIGEEVEEINRKLDS